MDLQSEQVQIRRSHPGLTIQVRVPVSCPFSTAPVADRLTGLGSGRGELAVEFAPLAAVPVNLADILVAGARPAARSGYSPASSTTSPSMRW